MTRRKAPAGQRFVVYTDGGCHPNPGRGGWGVVVLQDGQRVRELSGGEDDTTNNRMELTAALEALRALPDGASVDLHTDSTYVRNGITKWIAGWREHGWRTSDDADVKNVDLWQALDAAVLRHDLRWHWVRGHAGNAHNERADELASAAIKSGQRRDVHTRAQAKAGHVDLFVAVSYSGKADRGAFAVLLRYGEAKKLLQGAEQSTSANRLGLLGMLTGLRALKRQLPVRVFCASDYVVDGATRWIAGWQQRGWKTAEGKPVVNQELWRELAELLGDHVEWVATGGIDQPELMQEAKEAASAAVKAE